jgi:hypothetical protein
VLPLKNLQKSLLERDTWKRSPSFLVFSVMDGSSSMNLSNTAVVHLSASHPYWMLVWEGERWFSRFAQPALNP